MPGFWRRVDREAADASVAVSIGQRLDHRVAQAAFGPVVLGDDDVVRLIGRLDYRESVQWLD